MAYFPIVTNIFITFLRFTFLSYTSFNTPESAHWLITRTLFAVLEVVLH